MPCHVGGQKVIKSVSQATPQTSLRAGLTSTHHHIMPFFQALQEQWDIGRIMLTISIHENDDSASSRKRTGLYSCPIPLTVGVVNNCSARSGCHRSCLIYRPIIDDYYFSSRAMLEYAPYSTPDSP